MSLTPGKVAVVAEIEEDWTTPVDTRMASSVELSFVARSGRCGTSCAKMRSTR